MADLKAYHIPNGPKNLGPLFPAVNFKNVAEYYIEVLGGADTIATAPTCNLEVGPCCVDCCDVFRVHFLQYSGGIDAVNFKKLGKDHEVKSDRWQRGVSYPLNRPQHAANRFNVKANDVFTLYNDAYREEDLPWLEELLDSPMTWMEWKGTQGQPDSYIPLIILDGKVQTYKYQERYYYEFQLQATLSHERYIIRN